LNVWRVVFFSLMGRVVHRFLNLATKSMLDIFLCLCQVKSMRRLDMFYFSRKFERPEEQSLATLLIVRTK